MSASVGARAVGGFGRSFQRLLRRLCMHCRVPAGGHKYKAVGCERCNGSGYKGRVGLHELLIADEAVAMVDVSLRIGLLQELARLKARRRPTGESNTHCAECEEPIAAARRAAVPGVKLCIACQSGADQRSQPRGGINRRGSKDSQLK